MKILEEMISATDNALEMVREFAHSVDGIFVDYTADRFAVVVPLTESDRIQKVFGIINEKKERIEFYSMVCQKVKVDFEKLSMAQRNFTYARFIKEDDSLLLFASVSLDSVSYPILEEVIMEVAKNADLWERKFTIADPY